MFFGCSSENKHRRDRESIGKDLITRGVEFDWNEKSQNPGTHAIGVIAQEVEKQFPTAVIEDSNTGYKKVDYAVLVAPMIQALKELNKRITELFSASEGYSRAIASIKAQAELEKAAQNREIDDLKAKNRELELKLKQQELETKARLDRIEKMLNSK